MSNLRGLGRVAEDRAADYLLGLGYTIVTRRYKSRSGEIDIIALDGDILVFVEVKWRRSAGYIPEESVGTKKIARLLAAANEYVERMNEIGRPLRVDVIAIDEHGLRHHVSAIE